ncbi:hypothetical protein AOR_1_312034 [Paecilomyces variotii No. 5]|uniref:Uncharacterized protein n=1 Tax=Byssochlamys spectabilis (strain No. 5 / NBRC 109023) TaxID=1356009 RepID=V5G5Q2_BYSSN|nr:hypothetical protein AOR_1_312034 [Paecilomyces variotii No. 5]
MPSFDSLQQVKNDGANNENIVSCDHQDDSHRSLVASSTSHMGADINGKGGVLKRTWKSCKRPGSALVAKTLVKPILAKSSLVLLSTSLHNPTPKTIDFSMRVTLTLPVTSPVQLYPMVVRLCYNGRTPSNPFLEVTLPECEIRRSVDIEVVGKTSNILDMEQFEDFINGVMFRDSVALAVHGSAKVQVHGVRSRLQLEQHMKVIDYAIKSCHILPKAPEGPHLEAVLDLPNPSLATIEIGDLAFNLYVGPVLIGEVFISNVTLTPGSNVVSSRVYLDTKTAMRHIATIIQSQKDLLYRGKLGLKVSGKSTVHNGEHITYFENALSKLQLYSMVPVSRALGSIVGGIATSVTPGNILMILRMMGIMAILEGNGVDVAHLTQLEQPA